MTTTLDPSTTYIVTRVRPHCAGRYIEIAVGREAISAAALSEIRLPTGQRRFAQEWSQHADPLAAVLAAIQLQTALHQAGYGYWPLYLSGGPVTEPTPIRRGPGARRWALRVRADSPAPHALPRFVFVGERPSARAVALHATWQNGKLAGHTLRQTLLALALDPDQQRYLNLWQSATSTPQDPDDEAAAVAQIRQLHRAGYRVIGMGRTVTRRLTQHGIAHRYLIHPAARGTIRRRDRYLDHARQVLQPT